MTRTFRTALTAVLLVTLLSVGAGTAAAEQTEINSGDTSVVNDNDVAEVDNTLNNVSTNVLGIQVDDTDADVISKDEEHQRTGEQTEINSGETTVVNDDDVVDVDDSLNNVSTNVLGIQADDTDLDILSA